MSPLLGRLGLGLRPSLGVLRSVQGSDGCLQPSELACDQLPLGSQRVVLASEPVSLGSQRGSDGVIVWSCRLGLRLRLHAVASMGIVAVSGEAPLQGEGAPALRAGEACFGG